MTTASDLRDGVIARRGAFLGLTAAALFGFSTPLAKLLLVSGGQMPKVPYVAGAKILGSFSYGISVVLDAYALRLVGVAREAAYFATAPFFGAVASLFVLGDSLRWFDAVAMLLMGIGVALLLRERHGPVHVHEPLEHEHGPGDTGPEPHNHPHVHGRLVHDHPHVPDAHHRHGH